jgi:hypothetical protein
MARNHLTTRRQNNDSTQGTESTSGKTGQFPEICPENENAV